MQRRHSSITENVPPERSRSQTLSSETSLEESGVFEGLASCPSSHQQLFSGLQSGAITVQSALVLGSSTGAGEVFIQMPPPRDEGTLRLDGGPYHHHHHHHHRPQLQQPPALPQQPQHYHQGHQRSSLLHVATDRHGPTDEGSDEPGTPAPALSELRAVISWLQKGLPFILILLAKLCFQHKLGLAVCIGMVSTFAYANSALKHQVSLKEKRSILVVFWISVFLSGNTFYLLYTFSSQRLYNSLMFLRPTLEGLDFFDLIWMVGIADFVVKYATVILKCLILALPRIVLEVKSKGKFYLIVEELSQLFRTLVPIQLWYKYILGDNPSSGYFLGGVLIILYSLCKSFDVCGRIGGVRKALQALGSPQKYGVRATSQQCSEAGDICAICQADFKEPCALMCQHVFCEECLCLWFDKEKTCPLCRAVVVDSVRLWKDGTTSAHFQVY